MVSDILRGMEDSGVIAGGGAGGLGVEGAMNCRVVVHVCVRSKKNLRD